MIRASAHPDLFKYMPDVLSSAGPTNHKILKAQAAQHPLSLSQQARDDDRLGHHSASGRRIRGWHG